MTISAEDALRQQEEDHKIRPIESPPAQATPPAPGSLPGVDGGASLPATRQGTMPAVPMTESEIDANVSNYLENHLGVRPGKGFQFNGQTRKYVLFGSKEELEPGRELVARCDATYGGWVCFPEDAPPKHVGGLIFEGYQPAERDELGDIGVTRIGLSGQEEDIWRKEVRIPLADPVTGELFAFFASNATSRNAAASLIEYYRRMRRTRPGMLPVIKLDASHYLDKRRGGIKVNVPVLTVIGRVAVDSLTPPDTSTKGDLEDEIPF